jgi:hypothetical protein
MQIINKTIQCSECGCIALPDAISCPKCGTSYRAQKERRDIKEIFGTISGLSTQDPLDASQSIMRAYYQLICPHHGQVDVRTTAIVPTVKCPLCPGN